MNSGELNIQEQYYDLFTEEFEDLIDQLFKALKAVHNPKEHEQLDPWNVFFRVTHTLKGNAELMGFHPISEVSKISCEVYRGLATDNNSLPDTQLYSFSSKLFSLYSLFNHLLKEHKNIDAVSYDSLYQEAKTLLERRGITYPKN